MIFSLGVFQYKELKHIQFIPDTIFKAWDNLKFILFII